jgi:DNA modification methylase
MFSVKHDRVLDPFLGIGTSMHAAMAAARNFLGIDIDSNLKSIIFSRLENIIEFSNRKIKIGFRTILILWKIESGKKALLNIPINTMAFR